MVASEPDNVTSRIARLGENHFTFGRVVSRHSMDFGPYRLEEMLGRGGMGEVYRAYDTEHARTVAIKRLAPHLADEPDFQRRFREEAYNVAQLSNPHVVPIHKYGEIDGHLYIDMRFVGGGDLHELMHTSGALPFDRAVRILERVASALDDAHANDLVHRDVKPSNVLLDAKIADFCYLADFGITKLATSERSNSLTRTGALLGSLAYMAPEQFDGAATKLSDVYALTCVFFELLTGRKPYVGEGMPALMHSHLKVPPPRPSTRNPGAALFDDVIVAGMAKDAGSRFGSAGELARAARAVIDSHRSQPTIAPHPGSGNEPDVADKPDALGESVALGEPDSPGESNPPRVSEPDTGSEPAGRVPIGPVAGPTPKAHRAVVHPDVINTPHIGAESGPTTPIAVPAVSLSPAAIPGSVGPASNSAAPPGLAQPQAQQPRPDQHPPADNVLQHAVGFSGAPAGRSLLTPLAAVVVVVALMAVVWVTARGGVGDAGLTDGSSPATAAAPPASAPVPVPSPAPRDGPLITQAVYTGHTSNAGISVAVGIKDGQAAGYICDNDTVEMWLQGTISVDQVSLRNARGQLVITGTAEQLALRGTLTLNGVSTSFAADSVAGQEGFYESRRTIEGINERIGWIVLPDRTVGVRNRGGERTRAPDLDPAVPRATDVDGTALPVTELSGESIVLLPG